MVKINIACAELNELVNGITYTSKVRNFEVSDDGILVNVTKSDDGLCAECKNGVYSISYSKKNEFFRALALTVGKIEEGDSDYFIVEKSGLNMCGNMIDLSRCAVMKPEKLVDFLARMALMGMDTVMLYTEDTYEMEEYPYFGYMRGRYTKEELKYFEKVTKDLGIEMIPCIQTLAHLATTICWDYAKDMMDTPDILMIGEEKTYEFIETMIKTWRDICSTDKIHIGLDEADMVGFGRYFGKHGYQDRFEIMSKHLNRVCDIVKKYGFKPMMWSDMFFRMASKVNDYYDTSIEFPENLAEKIPEDLTLVFWDYYHEDKDFYLKMLENHEKLKHNIAFAGGAWTWRGLGPLYEKTFDTTFPALKACREKNVTSLFTTMWTDDGTDINHNTMLLGVQLFAEFNFYEEVSMEQLKKNFKLCTGYDADAFLELGIDDMDAKKDDALGTSKQIIYQDLLIGLYDKNFACYDLEKYYCDKLEKLEKIGDMGEFNQLFDYYRILVKLLEKKCHLGIKIRKAYKEDDKNTLKALADSLTEIISMYEDYHKAFTELWHTYYKPLGIETVEERIGGMIIRIKSCQKRLNDYLSGKLEKIGELDEELLWFGGEDSEGKLLPTHFYCNMRINKRMMLF